tara:strand:- start:770 stop:1243 length:474 start_codon:yes stop_codon:yes gene_type:complete
LGPHTSLRSLARDCGEFLLRREITQRGNATQRELVNLTDDELSAAAEELRPLQSWTAANAISCGSLSEQLRLRVIEEEIAIRSNESNHQRLKAVADNADYVAACNKLVASQLTAAQKWRLRKEVSPDYTFGVNRDFKKRSDADQTLIAYRDDQGWQV